MPALTSGTRLGPYEVLDAIGEGGMGEVYRAADTRLKRHVALKVLPDALTADPDRLARFQREAEVLAALNHPHIAGLHGLEESGGVKALVMELVEGPTLADRIAQGPIPLAEALSIARQIAEALAAAHEQHIIHRDLKPANIKLRPDGEVKVLDFGLAKAMDPANSAPPGRSMSPTITSPAQLTGVGVILGTAAYMSPEQAAGQALDRRTDLWSFGVVVMEMLTGRRVFDGDTVSHVIAAVLKDEPDWTALPPATPPSIRRLLRRCLERDRRKRWPDAATARMECDDALASAGETERPVPPRPLSTLRGRWQLGGALVAGAAIAAVVAWALWPGAAQPAAVSRFEIELPDARVFTRAGRHVLAVSPDGTQVAYVANRQLFLRRLDDVTAVSVTGTAESDPAEPIFSPDSKWVAYWSNGELKKIPVTGGTAVKLADVGNPYGGSWTGEQIVLGQDNPPAIVAVPANGGTPTTLVAVDSDESVQRPQLIGSERAVLFTLRKGTGAWEDAAIVVQDLGDGRRTVLVNGGTDGRVLPSGHLVYAREASLFAMPFDERRFTVFGSPVPVQTGVQESTGGFSGAVQADVSDNGSLVFIPRGLAGTDRALMWLDRTGTTQRLNFPDRPHWVAGVGQRLSPDGARVASRIIGTSNTRSDIWIGDIGRGGLTRVSFSGSATDPIWTPDGAQVCYESQDEAFCQAPNGSGVPQALFKWPGLTILRGLSPDGRWLLFTSQGTSTRFDVLMASTQSPVEIRPLLQTSADEDAPDVSPDGKWLAYQSDESGRDEVYVQPFPAGDQRWQISTDGGDEPRWSRTGRALFYLTSGSAGATSDVTIMSVPIATRAGLVAGPPVAVVKLPANAAFAFSAASDGRFLINVPSPAAGVSGAARNRFTVVQNWFEVLKSLVPTNGQ